MRALIYLVLGAVILAAGIFWYMAVGFSVMAIIAALVMGAGGALMTAGIADALDKHSPTSRKL
ncbi:hypothetical protein SAMN06295981_1392 [Corynebacterium pollutisoli]|uniref:Uncharacterized protein n=1 Tax=Corynebacterium pollutisoli TaxID=1610489 RepID=A0A1X7JCM4_9CORY|nr:hypothetical protein [Corynebacterium pollutisoli]SMG24835.1 hypothetical protein SAMN06295981_1392 [Corynebacterium pollutisoli]